MTELKQIREFLGRKRLAIVGVSRHPKDFTRMLFREFQKRGYDVVPVNPAVDDVEGLECLPNVREVQPPVEAALLMTSPAVTDRVVEDCAAAGVPFVWMYRAAGAGAVSQSAVRYCEANGIRVIAGECPFMFFEHTQLPHRIHGFCRKLLGRYPR